MSLLVIATIVGISLQFYRSFKDFQTSQLQDSLQIQAEKASSSLNTMLDGLKASLAVNLPFFRAEDGSFQTSKVQSFVDGNPDLLFVDILSATKESFEEVKYLASTYTSKRSDERFEDKKPLEFMRLAKTQAVKNLSATASKASNVNYIVANIESNLQMPLFYIAMRFDVDKTKKSIWIVVGSWQSEIIKNLPRSKFIDSYVLDEKQKIFSSTNPKVMARSFKTPQNILNFLKQRENQPSGYIEEFKNQENRRRVGAFSRSPKYKLVVVIEQDVEFAYEQTLKNIINIGLWAILFVLFAILLAYLGASGITKGLREVTEATQKIARGDFKHRIEPKTTDEVAALSYSINHMSEKILNLLNVQIERARFEKELETAKMVQSTFFPKKKIEGDFSRITGFYKPASECGGDLWAHFRVSPRHEYIFIGDAMGHGAPAALVTAMAYSIFMATLDLLKTSQHQLISPKDILAQLNSIIFEAVEGTISMTAFVALIDYEQRLITFSNAAHNFPIIVSKSAEDSRFPSKKKTINNKTFSYGNLSLTGQLLGVEAGKTYEEKSMPISPGDRITLYTDGIIECQNPGGQAFGKKRLVEAIVNASELDASNMKNAIVKIAFEHFDKEPLADDTTLVVVEIKDQLPMAQAQTFEIQQLPVLPPQEPLPMIHAGGSSLAASPSLSLDPPSPPQGQTPPPPPTPNPISLNPSSVKSGSSGKSTHLLLEKLRARRQRVS